MPRSGELKRKGSKNADTYDISVRQVTQQVLSQGLQPTTVWGYGPTNTPRRGAAFHHAPSFTIEAQYNRPVRVTWRNELVDDRGNFLPHLLPVDPTLHWAKPGPGGGPTDSKPDYSGLTYTDDPHPGPGEYGRYQGPVPIVTHVHGAMRVGDESDGYSEAWFLPVANDIPAGYATKGRWYDFVAAKFKRVRGGDWGPGYSISEYPNLNRASAMWYHDHTLGMTRLNVYAGPAGFYLLRGGPDGDTAVLDATTGLAAVLPGPAPREGDRGNKNYREIPLASRTDRSTPTARSSTLTAGPSSTGSPAPTSAGTAPMSRRSGTRSSATRSSSTAPPGRA
jgi:spore coat protein A